MGYQTPTSKRLMAILAQAIRDYRRYRKIHPEAFQVWACSEKKGAALLARSILRILKHQNTQRSGEERRSPAGSKPRA